MRVDNFFGKFGLIIVTIKHLPYSPQHDHDEKQCGRGCQPVPKTPLRRGGRRRDGVQRHVNLNLPPQRGGGRLIELSELQAVT